MVKIPDDISDILWRLYEWACTNVPLEDQHFIEYSFDKLDILTTSFELYYFDSVT